MAKKKARKKRYSDVDPRIKKWIDEADYESLLRKWRHAVAGDPFFQGEAGDYYAAVMKRRADSLPQGERVRASKAVGW